MQMDKLMTSIGGSARFGSPNFNDLPRLNNRIINNLERLFYLRYRKRYSLFQHIKRVEQTFLKLKKLEAFNSALLSIKLLLYFFNDSEFNNFFVSNKCFNRNIIDSWPGCWCSKSHG